MTPASGCRNVWPIPSQACSKACRLFDGQVRLDQLGILRREHHLQQSTDSPSRAFLCRGCGYQGGQLFRRRHACHGDIAELWPACDASRCKLL